MHGRYVGSWTWNEGDVILRIAGSGFPGLPPLLCCSGPVDTTILVKYKHSVICIYVCTCVCIYVVIM